MWRRLLAAAMATMALGLTVPAGADHQAPADGADHRFGDMVDYTLTFPVVGTYWYEDWFWAARANGLHHAQDIFAAKMTPVVAAASGVVTHVNWSQNPATLNPHRCCSLVIRHDDGWQTWYIHLNNDTPGTDDGLGWGIAPEITVGTRVAAGDLIGWVGDSGNAEDTSPHLHFELYDQHGTLVNPYHALRRAEGKPVCTVASVGATDRLMAETGLLRAGSVGESVRQLQAFLASVGHDPGPIDGIFGPRTTSAVRAFQQARGLTVDGIVGSQTRTAISQLAGASSHAAVLDPDGRVLRQGAVGGDVADLQTLLKTVGFDPGPADGVFGARTTTAVRGFQAARGITVDGIVGPGTRTALAAAVGLGSLIQCP